jgi:hypothetical protein
MSTDVSELRAASIIRDLMMEAARTSETSVDNHFTRQYNPEDSSEHHTRRRENLKSRIQYNYTLFIWVLCRDQRKLAILWENNV